MALLYSPDLTARAHPRARAAAARAPSLTNLTISYLRIQKAYKADNWSILIAITYSPLALVDISCALHTHLTIYTMRTRMYHLTARQIYAVSRSAVDSIVRRRAYCLRSLFPYFRRTHTYELALHTYPLTVARARAARTRTSLPNFRTSYLRTHEAYGPDTLPIKISSTTSTTALLAYRLICYNCRDMATASSRT